MVSVIDVNESELRTALSLCTDTDSVMVRASASGAGGRGFDPGPGHTKDFKNGTSGYLALALSIIRQALASLLPKQNI